MDGRADGWMDGGWDGGFGFGFDSKDARLEKERLPEYDDFMNDKLYHVTMMDGYRMIELGQELGYVKEMGQTCGASNGTSLMTPIALAVGTLAAADDSAGVFGSAGCWLPEAFGHFGLRERGEYGGQFAGIIEEILYPTLSNQHIHVYYILRFAYLGLFSTSTPKGSKRNSQGMSGQVDMMSISYISLNICPSIRFTVETRNRIFGSICTFPSRHAVPATRRQVLV